uniref:2',3'-cyclic nucleotide 3' phosphodiesterase n=2 Tax=Sus scrofa TaxID=9823 RepID=A0A8D0Y250_PIG
MLALGTSPGRRWSWWPTLGRDPRVCCTAQPSSVTTGRRPGQRSTPSRKW